MMETQTLDKLYLEWSQFTKARTGREIAYRQMLEAVAAELRKSKSDRSKAFVDRIEWTLSNCGDKP